MAESNNRVCRIGLAVLLVVICVSGGIFGYIYFNMVGVPPSVDQIKARIQQSVQCPLVITKPPCRIAVLNSNFVHYETLESIASLMPLQFINLTDSCDQSSLIFDYHVIVLDERGTSWAIYFLSAMQERLAHSQDTGVNRSIGHVFLHKMVNKAVLKPPNSHEYDAEIEASCYCHKRDADYVHWMDAYPHHTCIFHERCDGVASHPRAVWLSPHHDHHYVPYILPKQSVARPASKPPHKLCTVGDTKRRNWGLLKAFLDQHPNSSSRFRVQILGTGDLPVELQYHRNMTSQIRISDFQKFHQAVAQCSGILLLLSKSIQYSYFNVTNSPRKLTGSLPVVIAYQSPVILHEDLYDAYKVHFPENMIVSTHTDDANSFAVAMTSFLDKLDRAASFA